jgi:hypothetical protein
MKKLLILLTFIMLISETYTQQSDARYELLVYINTNFINHNIDLENSHIVNRSLILSKKLRNIFTKYQVETIKFAFPEIIKFIKSSSSTDLGLVNFTNMYVIKMKDPIFMNGLITELKDIRESGFAVSNFIDIELYDNDPEFNRQWYLHNTGQWGGTYDMDINAIESWDLIPQNYYFPFNIGVCDVGVETSHIELQGKSEGDPPNPSNDFHGTHVAGIIGAKHNNIGINGIDKDAYLVSRQAAGMFYNQAAEKVLSAVNFPCKIINNSWGDGSSEGINPLKMVFVYAANHDVLSVCAMGNSGTNNQHYPAKFGLDVSGIVNVGAINHFGARPSWGSYGEWIDVVAPGGTHCCGGPYDNSDIYSLNGNNSYSYRGGTSFSTPIVTGIASLLYKYGHYLGYDLHNDDLEHIIQMGTIDLGPAGWDGEYGYGRTDAFKTLKLIQPPNIINHYSVSGITINNISEYNYIIMGDGLFGTYLVKRYELIKDVTFPGVDTKVWCTVSGTNGWSIANPNWALKNCEIVPGTLTNNSARLRTYVYEVRDILDPNVLIGWYPCQPYQATFGYTVLSLPQQAPVFLRFVQSPPVFCKSPGGSGALTFQLSQGNGPIEYFWRDVNRPAGCNVNFVNNVAYISYTSDYKSGDEIQSQHGFYCWAQNGAGSTPEKGTLLTTAIPPFCGGCPWVYVLGSDSVFEADNNILHRSEFPENNNLDIKDLYKLKVQPLIRDSIISLNIYETENDYSFFDQFRLYAVDHSNETNVGITENNSIVVYEINPVIDNTSAYLNGGDISTEIRFHTPPIHENLIYGDSLDHINVNYPNNEISSPGIITLIGETDRILPAPVKYLVGNLNAYTNVGEISQSFARREKFSETIIPLTSLFMPISSVYSSDIDYLRKYEVRYISLTSLDYLNFDTLNLPLIEAIHSRYGDVFNNLLNIDQQYAEMDNQSFISLKFVIPTTEPSWPLREYILETNGRYITLNGFNNLSHKKTQINPIKFSLQQNYPNPFNPITKIKYSVPKQTFVKLSIYDIQGRIVKVLVNEIKETGTYEADFNGINYASGIYLYRLEAGNFVESKKMVLIK